MRKPRTRKEMIAYLRGHFRYDTMNSWNAATSYAANVKLHKLTFPNNEVRNRAYDLLRTEEAFDDIHFLLEQFAEDNNWEYQVGFNGRSGGYLVLYTGGKRQTEHKSVCPKCYQRNYKAVLPPPTNKEEEFRNYLCDHNLWTPETYLKEPKARAFGLSDDEILNLIKHYRNPCTMICVGDKLHAHIKDCTADNRCGRCGHEGRINRVFYETYIMPGRGIDQGEDFEEWDTYSLKQRVDLVWSFDKLVEDCKKAFVDFCVRHVPKEETYQVTKTRLVAREVA